MPPNSQPKWSAIKPKLTALQEPELIDLIKGLFDQSADNKLFLAARFTPEALGEAALEPYRKRIVVQFFPSRGFGKLNLKEARQAIRDYRKATSDIVGTMELMMTYVENGTRFTDTYGDINEAFYNSIESVLGELADLIKTPEGQPHYDDFYDRLLDAHKQAGSVGWGFSERIGAILDDLEAFADNAEA